MILSDQKEAATYNCNCWSCSRKEEEIQSSVWHKPKTFGRPVLMLRQLFIETEDFPLRHSIIRGNICLVTFVYFHFPKLHKDSQCVPFILYFTFEEDDLHALSGISLMHPWITQSYFPETISTIHKTTVGPEVSKRENGRISYMWMQDKKDKNVERVWTWCWELNCTNV